MIMGMAYKSWLTEWKKKRRGKGGNAVPTVIYTKHRKNVLTPPFMILSREIRFVFPLWWGRKRVDLRTIAPHLKPSFTGCVRKKRGKEGGGGGSEGGNFSWVPKKGEGVLPWLLARGRGGGTDPFFRYANREGMKLGRKRERNDPFHTIMPTRQIGKDKGEGEQFIAIHHNKPV